MNSAPYPFVPKFILSLFFAATSLAAISMTTYADEPMPRGHYTCNGVEVVPIDRTFVNGKTTDHKSDTLTHWIRFDIHAKFSLQDGTKAKPFQISNPTVLSKCSLTVDKPVRFKGKEVPAGTNLMKYKKFDGSLLNISMPTLSPFVINSIHIRDDFEFPPDTYTLEFQWETKDGKTISDTVKVRIDIGSKAAVNKKEDKKAGRKPEKPSSQ